MVSVCRSCILVRAIPVSGRLPQVIVCGVSEEAGHGSPLVA